MNEAKRRLVSLKMYLFNRATQDPQALLVLMLTLAQYDIDVLVANLLKEMDRLSKQIDEVEADAQESA